MGEEDHRAGQGSWGIQKEGLARYEGPTCKKGGLPDRVYPQKYTGEGRALQFLQKRSASHGEKPALRSAVSAAPAGRA